MPMSAKVSGAWKELSELHGKVNGEWKELSELYSKQDGVWVLVYSSGALLRFENYPYRIPTMTGWKYRFDDTEWETVPYDGYELNTLGYTWTGYVKATSPLSLSNYHNEVQPGQMQTGTSLTAARSHLTSFVNGNRGYVCGGIGNGNYYSRVEYYNTSGTLTSGNYLSQGRCELTSFTCVPNAKAYVCGGEISGGYSAVVDVYDGSGNRTTGTSLSLARSRSTSFILNNGVGFVCGGRLGSNSYASRVDMYDANGNLTRGDALSTSTSYATSVGREYGIVCGGEVGSAYSGYVDHYDGNGVRTSWTVLSMSRSCATSFILGDKAYICGGLNSTPRKEVDTYDVNGNKSTGVMLPKEMYHSTSFVLDKHGYVCGGRTYQSTNKYYGNTAQVFIYDVAGNVTTCANNITYGKHCATSFVLNEKGYVCGGISQTDYVSSDTNDTTYYRDNTNVFYNKYIAHVPITAGSTYTLQGITGTPTVSEVLNFEVKTTGTVDYKKGNIVGATGTV